MPPGVLRVLVVCALLVGVVLMHHTATDGGHEATAPDPRVSTDHFVLAGSGGHDGHTDPATEESGGMAHSVLHLCIAILASAALAVLGWLLVRRATRWWALWIPAVSHRWLPTVRLPRVSGSALVISLCVLRT
jgi:hypothetical protein